jgi:putative ABC transport system permease protein
MIFYRALLHLYPKSFRAEYGDEMCAVFARELQATSGLGVWLLFARVLADTIANAARVHGDIAQQDLKYAFRSLRRTPGFTFTAIIVAALGIGATTATFTIADHVLLRPLSFPESDRLVKLWENQPSRGYSRMEASPPTYLDWKRLSTSFDGMAAYTPITANLIGVGDPERLDGAFITGDGFQVLGRPASIGRVLTESDIDNETQNTVVISDTLWRLRFGADANLLGRTVTLNELACVVVGVMPPDFNFPSRETKFWLPFRFRQENGDDSRGNHYLRVVARLKPGVSLEQARSEMQVIADQLRREYPRELTDSTVTTIRWRDEIAQQPRMLLMALVGAALCVLLIACTNLANLLLSRALARRGELAIRAAVGASVDRLVRQMLTDSLVLAGAGGVLGVFMAIASAPLVARLVPTTLPIAETPSVDLRMLFVAAVITIGTGIAFGVMPAVRVCRKTDGSALKEGARGGTSRGTERLRSALVVAEIVASVVLLVSAGLLIQALLKVQQVDPGFKADNVLTLRTTLPRPKYNQTVRRNQFYTQVIDQVQALPGVTRAAYISFLPMVMRGGIWPVIMKGADPERSPSASFRYITPGFFDTVGTPVLRGRDVSVTDTFESPFVAVVSQSFVRQHFPDADPIGQAFTIGLSERSIVGVVGDIRVRGLERESEPQAYVPSTQVRDGAIAFYAPQDLVIRASVPASTLIAPVRSIVGKVDPQQPISNVQLMTAVVDADTAPRVVQLRVLGAFAAAAFLLAAIGIHGLLAFTVSARSREIGVRIALGARSRDILMMVIGRSALLAGIGVTLGVAVAYAAGRSMQSLLAGVDPANVTVFAAAVVLSLIVTIAGSLMPAWRAIRVDPLAATRTE